MKSEDSEALNITSWHLYDGYDGARPYADLILKH